MSAVLEKLVIMIRGKRQNRQVGHKAQHETKEHSASQSTTVPCTQPVLSKYLPNKRQPGVRGGATDDLPQAWRVTLGKPRPCLELTALW